MKQGDTVLIIAKLAPNFTLNLKAGWNMVGTTGRTELNITSIPNLVTQNPAVTRVAPSFVKTDKIKPGESAWVFVTKGTTITLPSREHY
ncbi:MAG TPA: hypothetical protein DCK87_04470 [Desulfotomaculum sp.]|nr:hypothetical protein [Desulfotomaculum sp.]